MVERRQRGIVEVDVAGGTRRMKSGRRSHVGETFAWADLCGETARRRAATCSWGNGNRSRRGRGRRKQRRQTMIMMTRFIYKRKSPSGSASECMAYTCLLAGVVSIQPRHRFRHSFYHISQLSITSQSTKLEGVIYIYTYISEVDGGVGLQTPIYFSISVYRRLLH